MAASLEHVLAQIQRWTSPRAEEIADAVLLDRFVRHRDESAFAALVARHGAMVMRSCRRVLHDAHEAEDAFQATFLVLARKAHTLRQADALPGFLHSVARRVALKARTKNAVRARRSSLAENLPDANSDPLTLLTARELLTVLDEEVARLPASQRSAVVLCCLEDRTQQEAAKLLGCTAGSLRGHLERGRNRLQARLRRRGITLAAALAVVAVSRGEATSALLARCTVKAALSGGIGNSAELAHTVLKPMFAGKLAGAMAVVLTVALAASTTVALVYRGSTAEVAEGERPAALASPKDAGANTPKLRTDALGDPLPDGAIARLGTVRLRHGRIITFAAFTPDGKRLVSQGGDGVRLWDAATGKQLRHFAPESGMDWGATDLSPDGKTLAAALESSNGRIDLWDVASGKKTASFGQGYFSRVRFSPDGKLLAVYSNAKAWLATIELWEVASRQRLLSWKAHGGHQVMNVLFSPDSQKVLTCALDGKIRIWDVTDGRQLRELTRLDWKPGGRIPSPFNKDEALSPDGRLLALVELNEKSRSQAGAIEWKARISLRDTTTGKQVRLLTCPSQQDYLGRVPTFSAVTFTPDGKKLLTGGPDRFLRIWDAATGGELERWPLEFGLPYSLIVSGDGKSLAAVMNQGKAIQLLDTANGKPRPSPAGHLAGIYGMAFTPDGRTAVTVGADGKLLVWDVAASRIRRVLKGHEEGSITGLQLAPDGRMLIALGWDKIVHVWDISSGEERRRFPLGQEFHPAAHRSMALSPDGGTLAVLSSTKTIRLLDTISGRELQRFEGPEWMLNAAFLEDGRSLAVCSADLKVRIWDAKTARIRREYSLPDELRTGQPIALNGPTPTFYGSAVSPDGRLLAVGRIGRSLAKEKNFVVLKDLATGRDVRRLDNLPAPAHRFAFSTDGRVLAWTGTFDHSIHLVETASGGERRRLPGHAGAETYPVAFSADGARLFSSGSDTTALVWDLSNHSEHRPAASAEMEALWSDLAGADAARAYRAIRNLAAAPDIAVPLLRKRLRQVPVVDAKRLARLLADLDSDDFAIREKATTELQNLGELALPSYRKALEDNPPLESRRRLEDLQAKAQRAWWDIPGERLRSLRAIETLELAGTKEAREVLRTLAAGAEGARLTEEAKAALKRLLR